MMIVGRLGTEPLAASGLAFNLNMIVFCPMIGLGIGVSSLVGRYLGAERPELAERSTWSAFWMSLGYMSVCGAAYVLLPDLLLAPYAAGADPEAFAGIEPLTVALLRFVAVYSIFDMMNVIFAAGLKGAGDTAYPLGLTVVLSWVAMLVPAYVLCVRLRRRRLRRLDDRERVRGAARPADAAALSGRRLAVAARDRAQPRAGGSARAGRLVTGSASDIGPARGQAAWGVLMAALVLLLNAAYVVSSLGLLHKPRKVLETDHLRYIEMARDPLGAEQLARTAPFCWRVLTPWLAFLLTKSGLSLNAAFYLLTNVFLFAFLFTLFLWLRDQGLGLRECLLGQALVGLQQGAVRWYEYQYWMTDPLCLFLVVLALRLIAQRRDGALGVVSVAGVLARESYLLVLPGYVLRRLREDGSAPASRGRWPSPALAVGALLLVRLAIAPSNEPDTLRTIERALAFRWRHLLDNQLYLASFGSFGVLLPMALLLPGQLTAWARTRYDHAVLVAGAYLSLALGNNTERLLAYALAGRRAAGAGAARGVRRASACRPWPRSARSASVSSSWCGRRRGCWVSRV